VTGAAGRIGTAFRHHVADRYALRLADRAHIPLDVVARSGDETILLDVADPDAYQAACTGIDTVLHLAADASPAADFYGSLLENNIKGTYNIFCAAKDQGCRRVVLASSVQVALSMPSDMQISAGTPTRPGNMYGVSKCIGKALAGYFADAEGLSSIAMRIGYFADPDNLRGAELGQLSAVVSPRDLCDLLVRCIETPGIRFAIVRGMSDNRHKRLDTAATRELLGYQTQDDAFVLAGIPLPEQRPTGSCATHAVAELALIALRWLASGAVGPRGTGW